MEIIIPLLVVFVTSLAIVGRSRVMTAVSVGADYVLVGVLLWAEVGHFIGLAYVVTGLTIGAIIWLSGARVVTLPRLWARGTSANADGVTRGSSSTGSPPMGWIFISTTVVLCIIVAYGFSSTYPLSEATLVSPWEGFVSYWLMIAGLLAASISRNPLRSGSGLLLLICGASATYVLISEGYRTTNVVGLLLVGILVTLVISRLAEVRLEEEHLETQP